MTSEAGTRLVQGAVSDKVQRRHRERTAIVYVRQSTIQQIERHRESTRLQYALVDRAVLFGWDRSSIMVDGVYDAGNFNDRLLLGLKGTMSEAELHILKARMLEGKRAKARRGELGMRLPMGYVRRPSGEVAFDPDEQAHGTIRLVFDLFERFRTVGKVMVYLVDHDIRMPVRISSGPHKGELAWHRANRVSLHNLFRNPTYAGAYVYGKRPTDPRRRKPGRPSTGRRSGLVEDAEVFLPDRVPAYITWEQYKRNQAQLRSNKAAITGTPRAGQALLSGMLICGRCGLRMTAQYNNNGANPRYACNGMAYCYAEPVCQSLKAAPLDALMERLVLEALEPAALEASLLAAADLEREQAVVERHWQQRIERARYEQSACVDSLMPWSRRTGSLLAHSNGNGSELWPSRHASKTNTNALDAIEGRR
jgi:Recombinase/Recombinase zinc beta ribbon domain